ncbi:hypothetical protein [Microcoleus sp. herbarium12]|uniref:hypothetical protein n=1 Tax=Microcoleus sp. herbarium12 TaxID=3055437 RepID=UPI002FD3C99B
MLKAKISWTIRLRPKVRDRAVLFPASERETIHATAGFCFPNALDIDPIESAMRDFAPCQRFIFTSGGFGDNNSPVKP